MQKPQALVHLLSPKAFQQLLTNYPIPLSPLLPSSTPRHSPEQLGTILSPSSPSTNPQAFLPSQLRSVPLSDQTNKATLISTSSCNSRCRICTSHPAFPYPMKTSPKSWLCNSFPQIPSPE
ncbi:hypothetical protein N431DRAFT_162620 [Stipitochalara longipes BDJ]|nr:hypothetical protein N431DRAFT_162620 [Stipitochalara longipes BDJ]